MSTLYVRSVKTHTLSPFTNTTAYFTASTMSNNTDDNTLDQHQQGEGNYIYLLIASNAHKSDMGNCSKVCIKYTIFRAVFAVRYFYYLSYLS